jgi:hypothetical protein
MALLSMYQLTWHCCQCTSWHGIISQSSVSSTVRIWKFTLQQSVGISDLLGPIKLTQTSECVIWKHFLGTFEIHLIKMYSNLK